MDGAYNDAERLASIASKLVASRNGGNPWPALFLFTDPVRTPDPARAVRRLPPGCGVIYRHFGAPERERTARALRAACEEAGHLLLIAADPALALETGAHGAHWPRWTQRTMTRTAMRRFALNTASAHDAFSARRAAQAGADIVFLSPVFRSESRSGGRPLGALRAGAVARAVLPLAPVYALGGVNVQTARRLAGTGIAGLAAVGALAGPPDPPASADMIA